MTMPEKQHLFRNSKNIKYAVFFPGRRWSLLLRGQFPHLLLLFLLRIEIRLAKKEIIDVHTNAYVDGAEKWVESPNVLILTAWNFDGELRFITSTNWRRNGLFQFYHNIFCHKKIILITFHIDQSGSRVGGKKLIFDIWPIPGLELTTSNGVSASSGGPSEHSIRMHYDTIEADVWQIAESNHTPSNG